MARTDTLGHYLTDVASAIKTKKGDNTDILASDFDTEILNLPSGDDWSDIGYNYTPQIVESDHDISKQIYDAWDSSKTSASYYFNNAIGNSMVICPLIDTSNITGSVNNMFTNLVKLREVPRLVMTPSDCGRMFYYCTGLEKIDTSGIDTTNCTTMYSIFNNCTSLKNISINFKTSNFTAVAVQEMFGGCTSLENINFGSNFKMENVTSPYRMFYNCKSLTSLDLSNFDFSPTNMNEMFYGCQKLTTINFGSNFDMSQLSNSNNTFYDCRVLDDNTLNKILELYINATNISTKTLRHIGFTSNYYPLSRWETLSNWQDFLDAGWTTGF